MAFLFKKLRVRFCLDRLNRDFVSQVNEVINHFGIVSYVGIGVGFGGNVLLRHALKYPGSVMVMVSASVSVSIFANKVII